MPASGSRDRRHSAAAPGKVTDRHTSLLSKREAALSVVEQCVGAGSIGNL